LENVNPNFWNVTGNPPITPGATENVISRFVESLMPGTAGANGNTRFIDPAQAGNTFGFDALNNIATGLGGLPFFATAFGGLGNSGGPATDFTPSSASGAGTPANTGDFLFTLGFTFAIGQVTAQEAPEPATLAVFAGLMGVGGLVYRKRRRTA